MSRWENWTTKPKEGLSMKKFIAEQESPADMARRMGLQSDGSGGYVDPSTGQVVARTVNNELVFYDPQGGAISAQSDGAQLTQAQPSWVDPVTGELTVPPGQPESPEEISAVPDFVPAQAPPGYSAFMNKKKKEMYANQEPQQEEPQEEDIPDMGAPDMGMEGMPGKQFEEFLDEMPRGKNGPVKTTVDPQIAADYAASQKPEGPTVVPGPPRINTRPTPEAPKPTPTPTGPPLASVIEQQHDQDNDQLGTLRKQALSGLQDHYKQQKQIDSRMDEWFSPLEGIIQKMEDGDSKNQVMASLLRGMKHGKRKKSIGNAMTNSQITGLKNRREELYDLDGGGGDNIDIEKVRKYVMKHASRELDDDLITNSHNAMSNAMQKNFAKEGYKSMEGWKKYLQQGGLDGYTGDVLDPLYMEFEHVLPNSSGMRLGGDVKDFVGSLDNMMWIHKAVNQSKLGSTFGQFYDGQVDSHNESTELINDFRTNELEDKRNELRDQAYSYMGGDSFIDSSDPDNPILREDLDDKGLMSLLEAHGGWWDEAKAPFMESFLEQFDPNKIIGMGQKAIERDRPEDMELWKSLRNVQGTVGGWGPDYGKLLKSIKKSAGFGETGQRGTGVYGGNQMYEMLLRSLAGKSREEQGEIFRQWEEATASGSRQGSQYASDDEDRNSQLIRKKHASNSAFLNAVRQFVPPQVLNDPRYADLLWDMDNIYNGSPEVEQQLLDIRGEGKTQAFSELKKRLRKSMNEEFGEDQMGEEEPGFKIYEFMELLRRVQDLSGKVSPESPKENLNFDQFRAKMDE